MAQTGIASWYGYPHHGRKTASGERYNMYDLTAAHRSIKLGTKVKVTNLKNNKSVIVKINDRGPFIKGRIIDLSLGAKNAIGMDGIANVSLQILD
jgi:rare lipoprotein A